MAERILFLTGHLARPRLEKVLASLREPEFAWAVFDVGVKVAALMTEAIITRRLPRPVEADRVFVPGRCRADLARLSAEFGLPFERGPEELKDLPADFSACTVSSRCPNGVSGRQPRSITSAPACRIDAARARMASTPSAEASTISAKMRMSWRERSSPRPCLPK